MNEQEELELLRLKKRKAMSRMQSHYDSPSVSAVPPLNPKAEGPNYSAEDAIPPLMAIGGGIVGGAATLPSGAGVPFGATAGAGIFGGAGQSIKNMVRAARGKSVPATPIESLKDTGAEGGRQAAYELGGAGVASAVKKVFVGAPRVLMNKVMNVSNKRLQAEALDKAEEIGTQAASEWGNFGKSSGEMLDRIKTQQPKIAAQVDKKISDHMAANPTTKIDTAQFFDEATSPLIKKLNRNPDNGPAIDGINELFNKYIDKYGDEMDLKQLDDLKKGLYDDIADASWWKKNEQLPDKIKATVAIAKKARKIIGNAVPDVNDLNAQYGTYAGMKAFLAGSEAGGEKSLLNLFVGPVYEKTMSGTAVGLQKMGRPIRPLIPAIPPAVQLGVNAQRVPYEE